MSETTNSAWPDAEWEMPLRKPLEHAGQTYAALQLREPTCAEWEETLEQPPLKQRRFVVSKVAGVPLGAVALMGIGDVTRAEEYLLRFFEVGQSIDVPKPAA
jgi:hypothetical protein